jgi:hypothetical protein
MKFSKWVFLIAGIYGLLVTLPLYNETGTARMFPPAVNHPEYYYGFIGTVIAWQVAFILISRDPLKQRPLIIPAIMEKLVYAFSIFGLALQGRVPGAIIGFAAIDFILGVLFVTSYILTGKAKERQS